MTELMTQVRHTFAYIFLRSELYRNVIVLFSQLLRGSDMQRSSSGSLPIRSLRAQPAACAVVHLRPYTE
jgi:hypothetical protein